jgi:hypothetical protein
VGFGFDCPGFAGGSLGSVTVPLPEADAVDGTDPSGGVTVPADAEERGEVDGLEGSSRLSFGTRCTPDADGDR